jgi:hypothetical protein
MKATEKELGLLHQEVAKQLNDLLRENPGNIAVITAAMKFLKDNRMEVEPENAQHLPKLTVLPADFAEAEKELARPTA